MSDKPTQGTVPMNGGFVKQHHRMAAGQPVTGQTLPSAPSTPKTPC
ncbi:hypothetical protein UFOVP126_23 [uncultured Caudovirales phage]|uniref:Uncharacterized protein n=1 Tax=uncultured Caudovirales phage TaxID=2100421 RepID=A0A6J5LGR8_9CAUD|nr:hypothetical protein UFOVP126_23 [uncultured Caudovirales phage]